MPSLIEAEISTEEFRRNWARLIQKVYHADPLLCPKCREPMRIISFIEDSETIKKILVHLGLWETRNHDPPPRKVNMHEYIPDLPEIKEGVWVVWSACICSKPGILALTGVILCKPR